MGVDHTMRADGKTADHVERAVAFVKAPHEAAMRGDDYATVPSALVQPAINRPWSGDHTLGEAEDWDLMCRFMAERYEPAEALARVRCPLPGGVWRARRVTSRPRKRGDGWTGAARGGESRRDHRPLPTAEV